ncbi:MAG: glycosyltransferase family 39 protein [Candidatus Hodarchaeota archaeon]
MKRFNRIQISKRVILDRNIVLLVLLVSLSLLLSVLRYPLEPVIDDYRQYAKVIINFIKNPNSTNFQAISDIRPSIRNRPVYPLFIAILTLLSPFPLLITPIIVSVLSILFSMVYIYRICKTLDYSRDQSFKVLFLFISCSAVTINFVRPITDNLGLLLSLMAVLYYSRYLESKQLRFLFYTYILAILALLTRELYLSLFLAFLLFPTKSFSRIKRVLCFFLFPLLILILIDLLFPFSHILDLFSQATFYWTPGEPFMPSLREFLVAKIGKWRYTYTWAKLFESLIYSIFIPLVLVRKELISRFKTNLFVFWGLIYSITLLLLNGPIFLGRLWLAVTYIVFLWVPYRANSPITYSTRQDVKVSDLKIVLLIIIGFAITLIRLIFFVFNWWSDFRGYELEVPPRILK